MSWEDGGPLDPPEPRRARGRGHECPGCGYGPNEPHDCLTCENCGDVVAPMVAASPPTCPGCGAVEWRADEGYVPVPDYDDTEHDRAYDAAKDRGDA